MLAEIRKALADHLDVMERVTWTPYVMSSPPLPSGYVYPDLTEFDAAMGRGSDWWTFTAQALIADVGDIAGQLLLDKMLEPSGPMAVKELVEVAYADGIRNLGLDGVSDVRVVQCSGYRRYLRDGGGPVFGAEWVVRVLADGN